LIAKFVRKIIFFSLDTTHSSGPSPILAIIFSKFLIQSNWIFDGGKTIGKDFDE
jgi:hypothetical protein